jgi:hypothetical protein
MKPSNGPLLGDVKDPNVKQPIQGGLLGALDRKDGDKKSNTQRLIIFLIFRVSIGSDSDLQHLVPQLNIVVSRLMLTLQNPNSESNPNIFDILRNDVSQMSKLISQYQMHRASFRELSVNPFTMPNIAWQKTSAVSDSGSSAFKPKSASLSSKNYSSSYATSSKDGFSGTESEESASSESSSSEEILIGNIPNSGTTSSSKGLAISGSSENDDSSDSSEDRPLAPSGPVFLPHTIPPTQYTSRPQQQVQKTVYFVPASSRPRAPQKKEIDSSEGSQSDEST